MASFVSGHNIGGKLCEVLGIPSDGVRDLKIICNVNEVLRAEVIYIQKDNVPKLVNYLLEFRAIPKCDLKQ